MIDLPEFDLQQMYDYETNYHLTMNISYMEDQFLLQCICNVHVGLKW